MMTIVFVAFFIRTFEISFVSATGNAFDFSFFLNAQWLTVITMTTVGYGDFYPQTHMGRFVGVIACLIGMILVSLVVISLTTLIEFEPEEQRAYGILKKINAMDEAKEKAADVILHAFILKKEMNRRSKDRLIRKFVWVTSLKQKISLFMKVYNVANSHFLPTD